MDFGRVVTPLSPPPGVDLAPRCVMTVHRAENGQAVMLAGNAGEPLVVPAGHGFRTPPLETGDLAICLIGDQGPIVIDRLRRAGENPERGFSEKDGHVRLDAARSLSLGCGESEIRLENGGEIRLAGRTLGASFRRLFRVLSGSIDLN